MFYLLFLFNFYLFYEQYHNSIATARFSSSFVDEGGPPFLDNPRQLSWDTFRSSLSFLPLKYWKDYKIWYFPRETLGFSTLNGERGSRLQGVKCLKNLFMSSVAGENSG